jgi:hypothetical protein
MSADGEMDGEEKEEECMGAGCDIINLHVW